MKNAPLVTVIVITYNSSKYVIETLESIKRQTYDNIQLVISDDCSTDDTLEKCANWADKWKERFPGGAIVSSTGANKGISGNYNNGLKHAEGKWIKYIAGDDYLTDDCLFSFVEATEYSSDKIFICGTLPFSESINYPPPTTILKSTNTAERLFFRGCESPRVHNCEKRYNYRRTDLVS